MQQEPVFEQDLMTINNILYDNRQNFNENDYLVICNCLKNVWEKKKINKIFIRKPFDIIDYSIVVTFLFIVSISIIFINVMTIDHHIIKLYFFGNKYYCWKSA